MLAASVSGGVAHAADLFIPADEVTVTSSSTTDWSGFYAGLHIGGGRGIMELPPVAPGIIAIDNFAMSGWLAGAQLGANVQYGNLVLGVEGDASWANAFGDAPLQAGVLLIGTDARLNAVGTLRGRIGFAADNVMFYATAGLAAASVTANAYEEFAGVRTILGTPTVGHIGWAIGAGAEAMVSDNISIKAEYLYHQFGNATYDYGAGGQQQSFNFQTVKVGANYHF